VRVSLSARTCRLLLTNLGGFCWMRRATSSIGDQIYVVKRITMRIQEFYMEFLLLRDKAISRILPIIQEVVDEFL